MLCFPHGGIGLLVTVHTPFPVESDIDFIFRTVPGMRILFQATEQIESGRARMFLLERTGGSEPDVGTVDLSIFIVQNGDRVLGAVWH